MHIRIVRTCFLKAAIVTGCDRPTCKNTKADTVLPIFRFANRETTPEINVSIGLLSVSGPDLEEQPMHAYTSCHLKKAHVQQVEKGCPICLQHSTRLWKQCFTQASAHSLEVLQDTAKMLSSPSQL